ncbi:MAG: GcrA cell cycle regulator [Boseongicola sp.]|nr:GcrA cell cycle regulator [Boseongicola sp.]
MSWTDERVEGLKKMWAEGKSASQIAKDLGGVTRNAVIGKVHRLGLSNRAGASASAPEKKPPRASSSKPASRTKTSQVRVVEVAVAPRKPIVPAGRPLPPQPSANEISPEALENVRKVEKTAKKIGLLELTERTCKWPIGDPATDEFWFCGLAVQQGKPYCEAHVGVAFQPMSNRRDRRR